MYVSVCLRLWKLALYWLVFLVGWRRCGAIKVIEEFIDHSQFNYLSGEQSFQIH